MPRAAWPSSRSDIPHITPNYRASSAYRPFLRARFAFLALPGIVAIAVPAWMTARALSGRRQAALQRQRVQVDADRSVGDASFSVMRTRPSGRCSRRSRAIGGRSTSVMMSSLNGLDDGGAIVVTGNAKTETRRAG